MLNVVKYLANASCQVPARDPSSLRSVRMTTDAVLFPKVKLLTKIEESRTFAVSDASTKRR